MEALVRWRGGVSVFQTTDRLTFDGKMPRPFLTGNDIFLLEG